MSPSSSTQNMAPRYARNNFPIEVIPDDLPTDQDREIERTRAGLPENFHLSTEMHPHQLLEIRYRHLKIPIPPSAHAASELQIGVSPVRPGRATTASQQPQLASDWNAHIADAQIGRFDGKFIEFHLPDNAESRYHDFVRNIAAEMNDPHSDFATDMTVLARRISANEMNIQQAFCRVANEIARRAAEIEPDRSFTIDADSKTVPIPQVFVSRGTTYVREKERDSTHHGQKDTFTPSPYQSYDSNKPDIFFNYWQGVDISRLDSPLWYQLAGAAEVKPGSATDMMLPLLIQLSRYQMFLMKHHSACGEIVTFTQCRDLLRAVYYNSSRYGTSRALSFAEPTDYENIVKMILFFAGPCRKFLPVWSPTDGMSIEVASDTNRNMPQYMLKDVKLLDSQNALWGRRTAVWSCDVDRNTSRQGRYPLKEDERLILKLAWNLPHLKTHELVLYQHISDKQNEGLRPGKDFYIPTPVGHIHSANNPGRPNPIDIARWHTRSAMMTDGSGEEHLEATTLVTKCKKAVEVFGLQMKPRAFLCYFRSFFRVLRYLATCEIHYRDVNPGNLLCDAETHSVCIVADYDFSRIGMLPRGSDPRNGQTERLSPYQASLDDSRSGSLYFMCRRVQENLALQTAFESKKKELLTTERKAEADPSNYAAARRHDKKKLELKELRDQIEGNRHSYIDDAESTVLNMFWTVARMQTKKDFPPPSVRAMHMMSKKKAMLDDAYGTAADMEYSESWALAMEDIVPAIAKAQGLVQQDNDRSRTGPLKCELDCYDEIDRLLGKAIDAIDAGAS